MALIFDILDNIQICAKIDVIKMNFDSRNHALA